MTTEDLVAYYHIKSCIDNNSIATTVIKEFESLLKTKFYFVNDGLIQDQETELTQQIGELLTLKDEFVTSPYAEIFFLLLEIYNYKMKHEIKNAITKLAGLNEPCHNKEIILKLLASPIIDDISFNGTDRFTISSEMYGDFSFFLATSYFRDNPDVLNYLSEGNMEGYCHHHTEKLSKLFPRYKSITSLCTNYFINYYYHSYSYNPEDSTVIDLCSKSVMDIEDYNCLFEPREVSVVNNCDIEYYYMQALKYSNQPSQRNMIFKIALYNHLNNMDTEEKKLIKSYTQS